MRQADWLCPVRSEGLCKCWRVIPHHPLIVSCVTGMGPLGTRHRDHLQAEREDRARL